MEANIKSKNIPVYLGLTDSYFELPIETEILVPDYIAEVFRIVKCTIGHTVFQKSLISGKILIEGYHRVSVFYQAEDNNAVFRLEQKLPFSKSFDHRGDGNGQYRITVSGQCEYLNCRAINQRRIDVRGSYGMTASIRSFADTEITSSIESDTIYQKQEELKFTSYQSTVEKQFTVEQEIELYETPDSILYSFSGGSITATEQVGDRIIIKGETKTSISYISSEGNFIKEMKTVPINQVIETSELIENLIVCPGVTITGCNVLETESGGYALSLSCGISAALYAEETRSAIADAFSIESGYTNEYDRLELLTDREKISSDLTLSIPAPLDDDVTSVVDCFTTIGAIKIQTTETGAQLMGDLTVHLICENELGELYCLDNAGEYRLPTTNSLCESCYIDLTPTVTNTTCNQIGRDATVEVSLSVNGIICRKNNFTVLKGIELLETKPDTVDAALCIYFADAGEAVFDIAKRYGASPEGIMTHNSLTDETLKVKQRLIVPV